MAWELLASVSRGAFKIMAVLFMVIALGVYTVAAIGAAILGASLSKH